MRCEKNKGQPASKEVLCRDDAPSPFAKKMGGWGALATANAMQWGCSIWPESNIQAALFAVAGSE